MSSRPWLWVTVVVFSLAVPVGYAPLFVLGPTIARETYDSAAVFGIVTAAYGAGALIGALVGLRWRPAPPDAGGVPRDRGVAADAGVVRSSACPWRSSWRCRSATGMGFALFEVFWDTTMAERIPPHALSRASAWEWMGSLALLPIGYLLAGPAAEATQPGDGDGHRRDPHRDRAGNRPPAARHAHAAACRARFPRVTRFGSREYPKCHEAGMATGNARGRADGSRDRARRDDGARAGQRDHVGADRSPPPRRSRTPSSTARRATRAASSCASSMEDGLLHVEIADCGCFRVRSDIEAGRATVDAACRSSRRSWTTSRWCRTAARPGCASRSGSRLA